MEKESGFFSPGAEMDATLENDSQYHDLREIYVSHSGISRIFTAKRCGRLFVLKCLREPYHNDAVALASLRKEYDCGYGIDSVYVVRTFDFEDIPLLGPTIRMEYCPGPTLAELIEHGECLTSADIDRIVAGLVSGLSEIHAAGILHRDIKPSNIIYSPSTGRVTIIDMGCADSDSFAILHGAAGTEGYTPADVANESRRADRVSDFYAAGATLLRLVAIAPQARKSRLRGLASKMLGGHISSKEKALESYRSQSGLRHAALGLTALVMVAAMAIIYTMWPTKPTVSTSPIIIVDSIKSEHPVEPEAKKTPAVEPTETPARVSDERHEDWPDYVSDDERVKNQYGVALAEAKYLAIFKRDEVDHYIVTRTDNFLQQCCVDYNNTGKSDEERMAARERYYSADSVRETVEREVKRKYPTVDERRLRGMIEQRMAVWHQGYSPLKELRIY